MDTNSETLDPQIEFASVKRIAKITGLSVNHLGNLRAQNHPDSPPWFRVGHRIVYPVTGPNGLRAWAAERLQGAGAAK